MRLKSIDLKGFKSFYHKTKIEFPDGIISIVGPNGSGKSNILDAFRWVLGEQSAKNLRGEKMEDVIFSGTKLHNQSNFCEIEILFDNNDSVLDIEFTEVSIKRKAYRSGESAYYINGKQCRLRDIKELLMDSGIGKEGYSIISQGKIDEIVNATSVQRRKILEEASGISKFRFKKEDSQKKLENTRINMERLNDIYVEIERQVEPLRKQNEKALKFLNLKEELKVVEINNLLNEYDSVSNNYSQDQKIHEKISQEIEELEKEIAEKKTDLDIYEEIKKKNQELTFELEANKTRLTLEKNSTENEIERNNEKILSRQNQREKNKNIVKSIDEKIADLDLEIGETESENDLIYTQIESLKREIYEKESVKNSEKTNIDRNKNAYQLYLENRQKLLDEKNKKELRIQFIDENIEFENKKNQENKILIKKYQTSLSEIDNEIEGVKNKKNLIQNEIDHLKKQESDISFMIQKLADLQKDDEKQVEETSFEIREIKVKQNMYVSMEKDMEGINRSVKTVLENKSLAGIVDIVANIIKTDKKYEKAIETVLGASLQNIVTADSGSAKRAVEFLKKTKSGRATFLPMDTVKGTAIDIENVKTASSVVESEPKYRGIIESLLGRTLLVESIDQAIVLSKKLNYRYRIVTVDGEIFNQGGSITGGHYYKQSNILGRKRLIEEYSQDIERLNGKFAKLQDKLKKTLDEKTERISVYKEITVKIQEKLSSLEKVNFELNDRENNRKYISNNIENILTEGKSKTEFQQDQLKNKDTLIGELEGISNKISEIESEIAIIHKDQKTEQDNQENLQNHISNLKIELSGKENRLIGVSSEKKRINEIKTNYEFQKQENQKELKQITLEISEAEKKLSQCMTNLQLNQIELDELLIEYENTISDLKKSEYKFDEVIKSQKLAEEKMMKKLQEKYKLENRIEKTDVITENVKNRIFEEYQLSIEEARMCQDQDCDFSKEKVSYIKEQINLLGNINLDAIDDYKALNERYEMYKEQISDLNQSIEVLGEIISDLEKDMAREFKSNFDNINETFGKVFSQLFGGGEGKLVLSNSSDVLNSEIEIVAQPDGKKLRSTSVMSGGEKSLMAIALLFSILMTKPAPFCILDEIDAALDDSNITRFNAFLEKLSQDIQFITITHRRGTMETSDYIYGVTMQDKGVSKVVSLKFEEATDFIEQ
ncbi:chromosome segregation protein SMC [Proteocatella sphenisci]|uniref:chromosome segregation protein SMC n=1 Tax=Proteocatella sphenisci TaxID=181070 RepID=UPI00048CFC69|nr:chromosome segregation protein SMC [Proteocatella sphenisci]